VNTSAAEARSSFPHDLYYALVPLLIMFSSGGARLLEHTEFGSHGSLRGGLRRSGPGRSVGVKDWAARVRIATGCRNRRESVATSV
jgi:hypothetical protein